LFFSVLGLLFLSSQGDACWRNRRRCCAPSNCIVTPAGYIVAPPVFVNAPVTGLPAPAAQIKRDKRLETDKRMLPEFTEADAAFAFQEPNADTFTVRHHDRGLAKTSYANAPIEIFNDLSSLILTLPDDDFMVARTEKNWDFDRVAEEQRNVRVIAYLFAVKRESDNDFHLILDDDGILEEGAKLNAEIAGVPNEGPDQDAIRQVRNSFKEHFNGQPPTQYQPFVGPIRVMIEGSLFFDRDHQGGVVGPQGFRPASAWEIHPIRNITFLPN